MAGSNSQNLSSGNAAGDSATPATINFGEVSVALPKGQDVSAAAAAGVTGEAGNKKVSKGKKSSVGDGDVGSASDPSMDAGLNETVVDEDIEMSEATDDSSSLSDYQGGSSDGGSSVMTDDEIGREVEMEIAGFTKNDSTGTDGTEASIANVTQSIHLVKQKIAAVAIELGLAVQQGGTKLKELDERDVYAYKSQILKLYEMDKN
ncbi:unnamed protein product [Mucor hiemalis]